MKRLKNWYHDHYFLVGLISGAALVALGFVCLFHFHNQWLFSLLVTFGLGWGFKHIPIEVA